MRSAALPLLAPLLQIRCGGVCALLLLLLLLCCCSTTGRFAPALTRTCPLASCGVAEPWEHAIAVGVGFYAGNVLLRAEQFYEELAHKMVKAKMDRNQGVLDDKYRAVLGSSYSKYYKEES